VVPNDIEVRAAHIVFPGIRPTIRLPSEWASYEPHNVRLRDKDLAHEIAALGKQVAVGLKHSTGGGPIASAFWINRDGYLATCEDARYGDVAGDNLLAAIPVGPVDGRSIIGIGEADSHTMFVGQDGRDLLILRALQNPFKGFGGAFSNADSNLHDLPKNRTEGASTDQQVLPLSISIPIIGDSVFMVAIESNNDTASTTVEAGRVIRIGLVTVDQTLEVRINTELHYRSSYCGAPLLNTDKKIVGIIGKSDEQVVAIPSRYLQQLIRKTHVVF